jgi:hypothetical protein
LLRAVSIPLEDDIHLQCEEVLASQDSTIRMSCQRIFASLLLLLGKFQALRHFSKNPRRSEADLSSQLQQPRHAEEEADLPRNQKRVN